MDVTKFFRDPGHPRSIYEDRSCTLLSRVDFGQRDVSILLVTEDDCIVGLSTKSRSQVRLALTIATNVVSITHEHIRVGRNFVSHSLIHLDARQAKC